MNRRASDYSFGTDLDARYELQSVLGTGGSSRVYRAKQRSTGQSVAMKILNLDHELGLHARERRKERFRREMSICGSLTHPDIVRLIDFGESGDLLYSIFELVPGRTLTQVLQAERALPLVRAHRLSLHILRALAYAHARGVIHRDLKPSNLMIVSDGQRHDRIKVLDFGISALADGQPGSLSRLTLSHEMVGTPAYAAPEQLRGDVPSAKTDLYSWGLILLECLTGHNPMLAPSLGEIFQRQLSPTPADIPRRLLEHPWGMILRWVLEKDPARRAGSAEDVVARLEAISVEDLGDDAGYLAEAASAATPQFEPLTRTVPAARIESERRQVTALCCRLVVSCDQAVADSLLLDAHRADLFAHCKSIVENAGGALVGGVGDLSLFCFGLRRTRETDARTALRVALELSSQVRSRSIALHAQSQMRVVLKAGLHTGLLTLGERESSALTHGLVAATASALALRGGEETETTIHASDAFRRVAERYAQFAEAGQLSLSWQAAPQAVHALVGESLSDVFSRDVAPLIGRDEQLAEIVRTFEAARERGRAALICAEPGLGKSRLAHEFVRLVEERGQTGLAMRCLPGLTQVALGPILELVRERLGLDVEARGSACEQNKVAAPSGEMLSAALSRFDVELNQAMPLLSAWLCVPLCPPFSPLPHSPQMQRAMLSALLVSLVRQMAGDDGFLLVEDLHWADPRTKEWLVQYVEALEANKSFLLVTARPSDTWRDRPARMAMISLQHLSDAQVSKLVAGLPEAGGLSPALLEKIVARADGVPLFAEELARALRGPSAEAWAKDVPETLRDLLMSRLDELGPAKETAQFAAALGREFDFDLLRASLAKDDATLLSDIDQLVACGLVVVRRRVERTSYLFRHALLRDAAYESLAHSDCMGVHAAIAQALLSAFASYVEERPDVVALHLELAGRAFDAQRHWLASGRRAMRDVAYDEARARFERGLRLTEQCAGVSGSDDAELEHLNGLLAANVVKFGFGAPELRAILDRAQARIERGKASTAHMLPLLWGQYLFDTVRPKFSRALPIAEKLLAMATQAGDTRFMLVGYSALIRCAFWTGKFTEVDRYYPAVGSLYQPARLKELMETSGEDSYMAAASFAGLAAIVRGDEEVGLAMLERLVAAEERHGIPGLTEGTLAQAAFGYVLKGMNEPRGPDLEKAREYALRARDSATRMGFPFWSGYAGLMEASARVYQGDSSAVDAVQATMEMFVAAGADIGFGWYHSTAAYGFILRREFDAAEAALALAARHVERSGEGFFSAEQARFEALLLRARDPGNAEPVRAKLRTACEIARSTGAQLFLARAERDLTRLDH